MATNTKHVFGDLNQNSEEEGVEDLLRGASLKETRGTILKRMILEIIPHLGPWLQENYQEDPQALRVIEEVKREKNLYKHVNEKGWNQFIEDLTNLRPEVHVWKNPPESSLWLADPKKHPFAARAKELIDAEDEDTLLLGWNQYCGLIACEILQGNQSLEKQVRGFPRVRTHVSTYLYSKAERIDAPHKTSQLRVWAWDKRNFETKE